jgi:ArsR family transcriptional regulator
MSNSDPSDRHIVALEALKLLANDTRWSLLHSLRHGDHQAGDLASACQLPNNLVSYHLGLLRHAGLVQMHRSDADARVLYYGLDLPALQRAYQQIGAALPLPTVASAPLPATTVVFLCTHNSARSQMAEGWLRHLSAGVVIARSAGVTPTVLHPMAVQVMAEAGVDIGYQHSKGLESLEAIPDVVVTVCDLAREQCPSELQRVPFLHWSIADPVRVTGEEPLRMEAFRAAREHIRDRVQGLLRSIPELIQLTRSNHS